MDKSETPRTDEQSRSASSMATYPGRVVKVDFAKMLEVELSAAKAALECVNLDSQLLPLLERLEIHATSENVPNWARQLIKWCERASCSISRLKAANDRAANEMLSALNRAERAEAALEQSEKDARRYRWLRDQVEYSPDKRKWEEVVGVNGRGQRLVEDREETWWSFSIKDDWEFGRTQDEKPSFDTVIDELSDEAMK